MATHKGPQRNKLELNIRKQPTDSTCGHTCLHAVYDYWNDDISLDDVIAEVGELPEGGTLAVQLAAHALGRNYQATIYTYNLFLFDPTWFADSRIDIASKLRQQREIKGAVDSRISVATEAYLQFLELGGRLRMQPLEEQLIVQSLVGGVPVMCGLSATFLYQESRERPIPMVDGKSSEADDVGGNPVGHFVVLSGFERATSQVLVADPFASGAFGNRHTYVAPLSRVAAAILLGIATYDANLLMIEARTESSDRWHVDG